MNAMFGDIADKLAACSNAAGAAQTRRTADRQPPRGQALRRSLRVSGDLLIESLPKREEFQALLEPTGLDVVSYRDESKLFVMVARKK